MKRQYLLVALLLFPVPFILLSGCEQTGSAESDFAPGAFPPTLSDTEYHRNAWSRADCLTCHAKGIQEAPTMDHTSVPALAKDAKCRTCHVFIPGSQPAY